MSASLEGLNPRFRLDKLAVSRARVRKKEFAQAGVDLSKAFDPVVNVANNESILFDETDIDSRIIEGLQLPRNRHALFHSGETMVDFAQKI